MLTVLDLFAGGGSFSRGLERTGGFVTMAACEAATWKWPLLRWSVPAPAPIYPDIEVLTGDRVLYDVGAVDVVAGSPPCTDISAANPKGRGVDGAESRLFFEFCRIVDEVRPRWVVAENSPHLRVKGADRVLERLEASGYAVWPLVVGAGHLGAPHLRDRVWIVGLRDDADTDRDRQHGEPVDGEMAGLAGGASAADGTGDRRPASVPGAPQEDGPRGPSRDAGIVLGDPRRCPGVRHAADDDGARPSLGQGVGGDARPELATLERTVGPAVHTWAGGLGRYLRMADGMAPRAARGTMSAAGDAVVEDVVECIGEAILAVDAELRAGIRDQ